MPTEPPLSPPPPPPPAPWHAGIDAELLGHAQNKGWKLDDPKEAFLGAVKQARELERHFGVPPELLVKMPKADAAPAEIAAFRQKLGMPAEAKDYDFSTIKDAAGQPISTTLADSLRAAAHNAGLTKDAAASMAAAVVKQYDTAKASEATITNAKLAEEKATLAKNWGDKANYNLLQAMEGARKLGITPEAVKALEGQIGYSAVMEAMRKIGIGTREDTFHEGGAGAGSPTTVEGAKARLAALEGDKDFGKRLKARDAATIAEWTSLTTLIGNAA